MSIETLHIQKPTYNTMAHFAFTAHAHIIARHTGTTYIETPSTEYTTPYVLF